MQESINLVIDSLLVIIVVIMLKVEANFVDFDLRLVRVLQSRLGWVSVAL